MSGDALSYALDQDADLEFQFVSFRDTLKKEWEDFSIACPGRHTTICGISNRSCQKRTCFYEYIKKHLGVM